MEISTFLTENKKRYEIITSLQDRLNHITDELYPETIKFIEEHKEIFFNTREDVSLFLYNIDIFTTYNFTKMELLLDICLHFSNDIKSKIDELEIIDILCALLCGTYYLYKKSFFSIETIIKKSVNMNRENLFYYFYPEIKEYDSEFAEKFDNRCQIHYIDTIMFRHYVKTNIEEHKRNREFFFNPSNLHKSIRDDNIFEFQSILSKNNLNYNYNFDSSFYERALTENPKPSLIQIAATYGAVHIFKFLWMQKDIKIDDNLICYAISGRNYEIIHICEQKCSKSRALLFSINSHQHELTDYFLENIKKDEMKGQIDIEEEEEEEEEDENNDENIYSKLNINLLLIAYQVCNYHILFHCLKKIIKNVKNKNVSIDKSFICNISFDFPFFKFLLANYEGKIEFYPHCINWVYCGMTNVINLVLKDLSNDDVYDLFLEALQTNVRIAEIVFEYISKCNVEQNRKELIEKCNDFGSKFIMTECLKYNENLIANMLNLFVNVTDPKSFLLDLEISSSKKFINLLFKKKINFGNITSQMADILQKNGYVEESKNVLSFIKEQES